jgi:hypothetical protein
MATELYITPSQPVTVTAITGTLAFKQNLWESVDVSSYDILDLEFVIVAANVGSTTAHFGLTTGMQTQTEDGWWSNIAGGPNLDIINAAGISAGTLFKTFNLGFLKYVRWNISGLNVNDTVTFYIRGMGRRLAG